MVVNSGFGRIPGPVLETLPAPSRHVRDVSQPSPRLGTHSVGSVLFATMDT